MSVEIEGLLASIDKVNANMRGNGIALSEFPTSLPPQITARHLMRRKLNLLESVVRLICEELEMTVFVPPISAPLKEVLCAGCHKEINPGDRCYYLGKEPYDSHDTDIYACSKKCAEKIQSFWDEVLGQ